MYTEWIKGNFNSFRDAAIYVREAASSEDFDIADCDHMTIQE